MIRTITKNDFHDAFRGSQYENNFTYNGREALFDSLEAYEEATDDTIELDICALSCEYSEYSSIKECYEAYRDYNDETDEHMRKYLENNTTVIDVKGGGVIIQDF